MKAEDIRLLGQTQKALLLMAKYKNTSIFAPITLPPHPTEVRQYGSNRCYVGSEFALAGEEHQARETTNFIANSNEVRYLIS